MGNFSHFKSINSKQFKHKIHEPKRCEQFSLTPHQNKHRLPQNSTGILNRIWPVDSTYQTTTPRAIPQLVIPHVCFSYEQQDYHTSWSPSRQHSHIREMDSQSARQGVLLHNVGWTPVSFWTWLVGYNQAPYKCRSEGSKCVDLFWRLVNVKDNHTVEGG